jgi:hypothetical protein
MRIGKKDPEAPYRIDAVVSRQRLQLDLGLGTAHESKGLVGHARIFDRRMYSGAHRRLGKYRGASDTTHLV